MQSQKGVPDFMTVFMFEVHITVCIFHHSTIQTQIYLQGSSFHREIG